MNSVVIALLVVVGAGPDLNPQTIPQAECNRAAEAVRLANDIRREHYAMESNAKAYCIPFSTAADAEVWALLEKPAPARMGAAIPLKSPN